MLRISERSLPADVQAVLLGLQSAINAKASYPEKVIAAKAAWASKTSSRAKAEAFRKIRETLALMCVGPIRCAYCEDSLADEIEHVYPKNFFPDRVFNWENYVFSCGPCNGPKGNRYGSLVNEVVEEFCRNLHDPIVPPPVGQSALVDPRFEDPLDFFELDLGGTSPDGVEIPGTFMFLPFELATIGAQARANFSIKILGLNREVMRVARQNAFGGFRARLHEYVKEKSVGADQKRLNVLREDILRTPHLTVFAEMRRQKSILPHIRALLESAPEAETWPLAPFPIRDVQ